MITISKILLQKAEENFKTAVWAEEQDYFDVAISRYYYYIFERIIYISKKEGFYKKPKKKDGSHNSVIEAFNKGMNNKLTGTEVAILSSLNSLKKQRKKSDYEERKIGNKNDFNRLFKMQFIPVCDVLERIIKEG